MSGRPASPRVAPQMAESRSAVRFGFLSLLLGLQLGRPAARSPRTADPVSEDDVQRLLHGVIEQLGIARPRVEYPAHQATNIVGPQSIQGRSGLQLDLNHRVLRFILNELTYDAPLSVSISIRAIFL